MTKALNVHIAWAPETAFVYQLWYLSQRRAAGTQMSLPICTDSSEHSLFEYTMKGQI